MGRRAPWTLEVRQQRAFDLSGQKILSHGTCQRFQLVAILARACSISKLGNIGSNCLALACTCMRAPAGLTSTPGQRHLLTQAQLARGLSAGSGYQPVIARGYEQPSASADALPISLPTQRYTSDARASVRPRKGTVRTSLHPVQLR